MELQNNQLTFEKYMVQKMEVCQFNSVLPYHMTTVVVFIMDPLIPA